MKVLKFYLVVILFAVCGISISQPYEVYSNDTLEFNSDHIGEKITLNFHKPETLDLADANTSYPITIVFDSHHQMTYPKIIESFDFLTIEALIPETLIVGLPFNMQNRRYLTSDERKPGDNLMGMERLEQFIFKELIPTLKSDYKGNDFLMVIGHSRTAFFVNYLLTKNSADIDIAVALSGFYKENPLDNGVFEKFLSTDSNFPEYTQFFLTTGTSEEESNYKVQYDALDAYLNKNSIAKNLNYNYSNNPHATHIVNYWMSIPQILLSSYSEYGKIINEWLFFKLEDTNLKEPVVVFQKDLKIISENLNLEANPSLTHIISFANHYYNTKNYTDAIDFLKLGLDYFPAYLDFYPFIIELYQEVRDNENKEKYIDLYKALVNSNTSLSPQAKKELLNRY